MSDYKIEKVEPIETYTRTSSEVYYKVINDVAKQEVGWYKITIPNKKVQTVYQQLAKRIKGRNDLQLHKIKNVVYFEKLSVKK